MSKNLFSLEDLTEAPLYESPDEATTGAPVEEVTETQVQEEVVVAADEQSAVESAILFAQFSMEHLNTIGAIMARSSEAVQVEHKLNLTEGFKKIWEAIKAAFRRLIDMIQKFFFKISNFLRSGGIKEKIAYIQKNIGNIDYKKIDGNKKVTNPDAIVECLKVAKFKVPGNWVEKIADNLFGVEPTKIRAEAMGKAKEPIRLEDAVKKAKGVLTDGNLTTFQKTIGEVLKDAKAAQKIVDAKAKDNAGEDADKKKEAASNSRMVLKNINDASYLGIRGFSWFLTAVNYTYGAIKSTEKKAE